MGRLSAHDLIDLVLDDDSWTSWDTAPSRDGISEAYAAELTAAAERSGVDESVLTGEARLHGRRIGVLVGEFGFLAGSIGRAAADRIVAGIERATREGLPLVAAPMFWAFPTRFLRASAAAAGIAVINSIGNLAGYAGPWMMGLTKEASGLFGAGLLVLAAAIGLAALLALDVRARRAPAPAPP